MRECWTNNILSNAIIRVLSCKLLAFYYNSVTCFTLTKYSSFKYGHQIEQSYLFRLQFRHAWCVKNKNDVWLQYWWRIFRIPAFCPQQRANLTHFYCIRKLENRQKPNDAKPLPEGFSGSLHFRLNWQLHSWFIVIQIWHSMSEVIWRMSCFLSWPHFLLFAHVCHKCFPQTPSIFINIYQYFLISSMYIAFFSRRFPLSMNETIQLCPM